MSQDIVRAALSIAYEAHEGQVRKGPKGEPYILHCVRVAFSVMDLGDLAVATALLHDTLEDTDWTQERLRDELTLRSGRKSSTARWVSSRVASLTRDTSQEYFDYIDDICEGDGANLAADIKEADILDNLANIEELGKEGLRLKERYKEALKRISRAIT